MAQLDYDVIVTGGGMAGTIAAIAAARNGARSLLIEKNRCLGGAATMRGVNTWCGLYTLDDTRRQVVGGIADEVLAAQDKMGALGPIMAFRGVFRPFDPEPLKPILDRLALQAGVHLRYGATLLEAARDEGQITSVTFGHTGGRETATARAFVDATGDGDLAHLGVASTRYGNPDGVNLGTLATRFGGIPANVDVPVDALIAATAGLDGLTKDRSVIVRLPGSGDMVLYLASERYDPRDAAALTSAEISARQQAWRYLEAIRRIPGCARAYIAATGPEIGTRESRHLNCRAQLTWDQIAARQQHEDCIALGAWGAEWHDRQSYESSFEYPPEKSAYEIPLAALHSVDTPNLFTAGRLADGDRRAGAAIRVMGTAMATGQAAGIAAALCSADAFSPKQVQTELRAAGAILNV